MTMPESVPQPAPVAAPGGGRALAVWGAAVAVYVLAVFHRSSLGVAGLVATERFDITASQLATFTMLQLAVYAAMQVPTGLLLDRFGPRRVLVVGITTLTVAQAGFAYAGGFGSALAARVFVGVGDALVFICVLRLVTAWFPPRRIPLVTQATGFLGQLGALAAAVPMTIALRDLGWTGSYLLAAGVGVVLGVVLLVVVADSPAARVVSGPPVSPRAVVASLRASWAHPGTRLGLWVHFSTQFSATVLSLLWGYPYFVRGEGVTPGQAGLLLSVLTASLMVSGPVVGWFVARHQWYRSTLVLSVVAAIVGVWTVTLVWPGPAPLWLLVVLCLVVGAGGPASMVAFDLARTSNPAHRLGSATGIVNQGGFVASLLTVIAIGIVLDWRTPGAGTTYTPEAFVAAMSVQYAVWALGLTQIWRYRRRARALAIAEGDAAVPPARQHP